MVNSASARTSDWYQVWVPSIGTYCTQYFFFVIIVILVIYLFKVSIASGSHSTQNMLTDCLNEWMIEWIHFIQGPDLSLRPLFSSTLLIFTLSEIARNTYLGGKHWQPVIFPVPSSPGLSSLLFLPFPLLLPSSFPPSLPPEAPDSKCWEVSSNRIEITLNIKGL